ncbi:MAG: hypothetical protein GQ527_10140 [Bacteroidales bacterium]|nr:hypothetical protein [Bacteroidales bacterium]
MSFRTRLFPIILFTFLGSQNILAQGCSDAGVCSATQYIQNNDLINHSHNFTLTQSAALGDQNAWIIGTIISYQYRLNKTISFGASLPYSLTIGNLGTTHGFGDLILNANINVYSKEKNTVSWFIAGKIASGNSNTKLDNNALPMVYQQSSGTNDVISAINWNKRDWLFAIGYQHAYNTNENAFLSSDFPENSSASNYHSSAYLKRGDDVMIRIQKIFDLKSKSKIKAGILPIYRIQQDEIKVENEYTKVENSNGLTLNLYMGWMHELSKNISGELQLAAPPITREVRVDGTTRTFLVNYIIKF